MVPWRNGPFLAGMARSARAWCTRCGRPARAALMGRLFMLCGVVLGAAMARGAESRPVQAVPLPYNLPDDRGSTWDVQFNGSIGDGGNDLYDGGGILFVNEQQPGAFQAQGRFDAARNEITVGPWPMGGLQVTRKVAVDAHAAFCRYTEVLENPSSRPIHAQLRVHFSLGSPIQQAQTITEQGGRHPRILGVAVDNGRNAIGIVGAGRRSKLQPRYEPRPGSTSVDLRYELTVSANQTVAIVHVEVRRGSAGESADAVRSMKERVYLDTMDPVLRKRVVNFSSSLKRVGEDEVFRGESLDVIEFADGSRLEGTLGEVTYDLATRLGRVSIPGRRVICVLGDGVPSGNRRRVVLADGQVFAGRLLLDHLPVTLANGDAFDVPLSRIARVGYRIRPGEPESWSFNQPMLWLTDGTRLFLRMPARGMQLQTMYGLVSLPVEQVARVLLRPEEHGPHEVVLVDGSHLSGLLVDASLDLRPADPSLVAGTLAPVLGELERLQFASSPAEDSDTSEAGDPHPTLALENGDELVGALTGSLHLTGSFDAFDLNADEVRALHPAGAQTSNVQVELWDGTVLTGLLQARSVHCAMLGGVQLDVPISLVKEYRQPRPRPSSVMTQRIEQLIGQLDARGWKQREWAQEQLTAIGVAAIPVLKAHRRTRSPESLQRIELVLQALEGQEDQQPGR